jgi:hypothetical protein
MVIASKFPYLSQSPISSIFHIYKNFNLNIRSIKFLDIGAFQQFTRIYNPFLVEFTEIPIDWSYKWEERFADLIEQFKANHDKKIEYQIVFLTKPILLFKLNL